MDADRGRALAWLGHPVTVAALALLIVNDHVLKAAYPGWVTGKLSDAAGMVLAPPLLAVLICALARRAPFRRVAAGGLVAVGGAFTVVKSWGYGAELASALWSTVTPSLIRADPTDLLALPFLAVAWWTARRPLPDPFARRWLRALRLAVVLPVALAGVVATSPVSPPSADSVLVGADGALHVGSRDSSWSVSRDAGRSWQPGQAPVGARPVACAGPVCYRIVPGEMAVQTRTGDGPWVDSWRISELYRQALFEAYGGDAAFGLRSLTLSVVEVAGGHVVVVANDRDGFARRDEAGVWQRIGFPDDPDDPAPIFPERAVPERQDEVFYSWSIPLVLAVALVLTLVAVLRVRRAGGSELWWLLMVPLVLVGTLPSVLAPAVHLLLALVVSGCCVVVARVAARPSRV